MYKEAPLAFSAAHVDADSGLPRQFDHVEDFVLVNEHSGPLGGFGGLLVVALRSIKVI